MKNLTTKSVSSITTTEPQKTIKVWDRTLKKLRLLHAHTGKSMVSILEELVSTELDKEIRDG